MVIPILPFIGLTVGSLIKQIIADYTADMAKKKLAKSFLIERIDKKLENKYGKEFLKSKLDDKKLEEIRKVVHDELSAYSSKKDLDQLVVNSVKKLSDEHQQILIKLENVESLLEKISIPLAYSLTKESDNDFPEELLTGLLEGSIKGSSSSEKVLEELTQHKQVPTDVYETLKEFEFIKRVNEIGETEISNLVKKFTRSPDEINSLSTLMEISSLLTGSNEELENFVSEFVFKLISEGVNTTVIEDSVISFCFLVQKLGKLSHLSESDRLILNSFLRKIIQRIDDPTRMLESYFILSAMNMAADIDSTFIKEIIEQHHKQGHSTTKEMVGQLRVTGRVASFLKRLGFRPSKPDAALRTIKYLISKLDKRKFLRSTQLLKYQLERLTTEMNLMISYFEREKPSQEDLTEIVELIQLLLEILNRPNIAQLDLETRKRVIELMDASCYLYDLIAIRNSWSLLNSFKLDVQSLYSPTLGDYNRINTDQAAFNRSLHDYSRKRLKLIERDLPSPPRKNKKQQVKE
ncbi:MAG: hypothetical protein ACFFAU_08390 [Candidatus Hodarchaeota archaeon]